MNAAPDEYSMLVGWEHYARTVVPPGAGTSQHVECRRAFYAGAVFLFGALVNNEDLPETVALARRTRFEDELRTFVQAVAEGRA